MADIAAFRGIHYNTDRGNDLAALIAPPYDVMDDRMRDRLYDADPANFVRIILNRPEEGDTPGATHRRAARTLAAWLDQGVLVESTRPSLYVYRQTFPSAVTGRTLERTGVFAALQLSPYEDGVVLPHEYTKPRAKADRLELMRATRANTEPIMVLYEDPGLEIIGVVRDAATAAAPILHASVEEVDHTVWAVDDPDIADAFARGMAYRRVWIADGHHRYETALTYRDELRMSGAGWPDAERILVTLIPFEDPGLVILPTHRMIKGITRDAMELLITELDASFSATPVADDERLPNVLQGMRSADGAFIMAVGHRLTMMHLRSPSLMAAAAKERSAAWRALDVAILQTLVLDPLIASHPDAEVVYTRYPAEALACARAGDVAAAFLVGYPTSDDLRDVTAAGDRMPAKSTYFDPKLWSGLIMRLLGPAESEPA